MSEDKYNKRLPSDIISRDLTLEQIEYIHSSNVLLKRFKIFIYISLLLVLLIGIMISLFSDNVMKKTIFLLSSILFIGTCFFNYINERKNKYINPLIERYYNTQIAPNKLIKK